MCSLQRGENDHVPGTLRKNGCGYSPLPPWGDLPGRPRGALSVWQQSSLIALSSPVGEEILGRIAAADRQRKSRASSSISLYRFIWKETGLQIIPKYHTKQKELSFSPRLLTICKYKSIVHFQNALFLL